MQKFLKTLKLYCMVSVLLIDSDKELHTTLRLVLPLEYKIISAYSGKQGLELMQSASPEIILLTGNLPDISGIELLYTITNSPFSPPVIVIAQDSDISFIVQSVKIGAFDYIKKPIELEKVQTIILKALHEYTSVQNDFISNLEIPELSGIIGNSREMQKIKSFIVKYAPSRYPILITGESGTGKELIAHAIHRLSLCKDGPFVPRNCGAMPTTLIQSELFGSEKGAYTDAVSKPGSFELANHGSLFLDEIGEMDLLAQVQLLRVLESNELIRLGGIKKIKVNVRIITATNKDLKKAIENGEFRKDLFYRINNLIVKIPPLRERKNDIPLLAQHFLSLTSTNNHILPIRTLQKLREYTWPGNVRELKSTVERAVLLSDTEMIEPNHIVFSQ